MEFTCVYYRRPCLDWGYVGNAGVSSFRAFMRQLIDFRKRGFSIEAITDSAELRKIAVSDGQMTLISDVFAVKVTK